jgi:uncharacterized lipoprotein YmbA
MNVVVRPVISLGAALLLLGGCSPLSPRPDTSRFFVLTTLADSVSGEVDPQSGLALGLGPITVAAYLDKPHLVTRVGANQVEFSSNDRWAEPVPDHIAHILMLDLVVLLGTDEIESYPWYSSAELDYVVEVAVLRFERDPQGGAVLVAMWVLQDGESRENLVFRETRIEEPSATNTTESSVAALSRALVELSREIADAIREQERVAASAR